MTVWPPNDCPGATVSRLVPSASICATSWARLELETPSTATMVAMPSATPTAESAARAGLLTRPSTASGQVSAARRRLAGRPPAALAAPPRGPPHAASLSCSIRPSRSRITRRAASAISGLWVTTRIVVPPRFSSASRVRMPALVAESRLPVGSSARMMAGRPARARAMATRWHSPPDSSAGRWPARPDRPTSASASAAAARRCAARDRRGTAARWPRCPARSAWAPGRTAGTRTRSGPPGPRTEPCRAARRRRARPPGRCPRSGVPGCRRWPAWSTCPTRTARRSR